MPSFRTRAREAPSEWTIVASASSAFDDMSMLLGASESIPMNSLRPSDDMGASSHRLMEEWPFSSRPSPTQTANPLTSSLSGEPVFTTEAIASMYCVKSSTRAVT